MNIHVLHIWNQLLGEMKYLRSIIQVKYLGNQFDKFFWKFVQFEKFEIKQFKFIKNLAETWPRKIPRAPRSEESLGPKRPILSDKMLSHIFCKLFLHILMLLQQLEHLHIFLQFSCFYITHRKIMKYIYFHARCKKKCCLSYEAGREAIPFPFLKIQFRYSSQARGEC